MADDVLRLERICKSYNVGLPTETPVLRDIDMTLGRGEFVAVMGPSGSGKSTLLNIVGLLDRPTSGRLFINGADTSRLDDAAITRLRGRVLGFVFQYHHLISAFTARENVMMAMSLAATPSRGSRSAELLDMLQIAHLADRMPAQLSGGEQQRVAIAVSLANEPEVLLADEPTGELDDATSAEVLEVMRTVNRELGVTTLIVTHDPAVSEHVRRTVLIRDGRTSTEVFRSHGEDGEHSVAEEFTVIDRSGRLQLPAEYVSRLQLRDRVRLELETTHVRVSPAQRRATDPAVSGADPGAAASSAEEPEGRIDEPYEEEVR